MAYLILVLGIVNVINNSQDFTRGIRRFSTNFLRVFISFHYICTVLAYKIKNMMSLAMLYGIDSVVL